MKKLEKIKDPELRARLEAINNHLRTGKASEAVRDVADVFVDMLNAHPEIYEASSPGRMGRRTSVVARWPALGANLAADSIRERKPRIEFKRDRFAMSEAITYYEFTIDTAIAQGL